MTKEEILIKALLKKWHLKQNQPLLVQILQNLPVSHFHLGSMLTLFITNAMPRKYML